MADRDIKPENMTIDAKLIAKLRILVEKSKDPRAPDEFTGALALAVPILLDEVEAQRAALAEALTSYEAMTVRAGLSVIEEHETRTRIAELRAKFLGGPKPPSPGLPDYWQTKPKT